MMLIDRRSLLAAGAALAAAPALARRKDMVSGWYDRGIVIDALGGLTDPYEKSEVTRWSTRAFDETMATGVTMLRDTIFPVGNVADPWGEYQKAIKSYQNFLAANPDRIILVRSAADILKAKREKKFGTVIGTQDSCMIGTELDRLAQMKKDGVLSIQLTYNNRNLAGDGALEPANAGLSKLGRATIERVETEKKDCSTCRTAARGRWRKRRPWRSDRWSSATQVRGR